MYYGQKNYPEKLGNGNYTIAEAGCFLTAFANLAVKLGEGVDPLTLNTFFISHGVYQRDSDGANEDLAWGSITAYHPDIIVTSVANGGTPTGNNAIVKFHYNSVQTGIPIDHFCLVDHVDGNEVYIIDSWDGELKAPSAYESIYHLPLAWATYTKNAPTPPPAMPTASAPVSAPSADNMYNVVKEIPGYISSGFAAAHKSSNSNVPVGTYYIFNTFSGMINVTRILGLPGWWINPVDNSITPPPAPPEPEVVAPPAPAPPAPPDWRTTYVAFRNKFGDVDPKYYVAMTNVPVIDQEGKERDQTMPMFSITPIGGKFTGPDGTVYLRPQSAANKFLWYGMIEIDPILGTPNLELEVNVYDTTTTTATRVVTKTVTPYDRVVLATATIEKAYGTIEGIIRRKKSK